jgi:hypothetical protein
MTPLVPTSWGELFDKISILEIKLVKLTSDVARANVRRELERLMAATDDVTLSGEVESFRAELRTANEQLWDIEDSLREKEALQSFDEAFIDLARSVYRINDRRGRIKRQINLAMQSELIEEKQYSQYD